jgi:uncharacterized membrane protein YidH (DUF202 family)
MSIVKKYASIAGLYGFVFALTAFADSATLVNPLGTSDATVVLGYINTFLIAVAAPICGIMVVWGGFQMITAAGNPEKFSSGKKTLLYAAIGFVVVIFASSVVPLIKSVFNGS